MGTRIICWVAAVIKRKMPLFLAHPRITDNRGVLLLFKSDKLANFRGGIEGPAYFDLLFLPLVSCSSSMEQDALCRLI